MPTHAEISPIRVAGMVGADRRKTYSGPMFACIIDMEYLCWQRAMDIRKETPPVVSSVRFFFQRRGTAYAKTGLISMFNRARSRAGLRKEITFKDLRALAQPMRASGGNVAQDSGSAGANVTKTTEIYIKEVVPKKSDLVIYLP